MLALLKCYVAGHRGASAIREPLALVAFAGLSNAVFLMSIVVATLYLSRTETDPRVKDRGIWTVYLGISAVAVFAVGALGLMGVIKKF